MSYESMIGEVILSDRNADEAAQAIGLRLAVQHTMFCPVAKSKRDDTCGRILDVRKAVLIECSGERTLVMCAKCFDRIVGNLATRGEAIHSDWTITDGRKVEW